MHAFFSLSTCAFAYFPTMTAPMAMSGMTCPQSDLARFFGTKGGMLASKHLFD